MSAALSSLWFFMSPIPDISNKGKPKPISAASMSCSSLCSLLMLFLGYQYWNDSFPLVPMPFYPLMLFICCCSCCSSSKLVGQGRKFAKI